MYQVTQKFDTPSVEDAYQKVCSDIAAFSTDIEGLKGQSVAVAVGSRGIDNLYHLVRGCVDTLLGWGLKPFIVPAMGSHGGAAEQGQRAILANLGITEASVGVPIDASMDVISLGTLPSGAEVFFSQAAYKADHLVIIARIKPHTLFRAAVESGLCKMLAIGCGKFTGASELHRFNVADQIVPAAQYICKKVSVLFGIAVVENECHKITRIQIVRPEMFVETDQSLLVSARHLLPRLPFDDLDILIVDEMGKNISGGGMDPNVYGFWRRDGGPRIPDYRTLIVLDLTAQSHGNAVGIGMADLITRHLADKINWEITYKNAITSGVFRAARMPLVASDDRNAIELAVQALPHTAQIRIARIVNTLELQTFWVSSALLPELRERNNLKIHDESLEFLFSQQNRLLPFVRRDA
jgi:hypothetical protein